jgi:glycosyltransferase involved in cell wall biosynthesis
MLKNQLNLNKQITRIKIAYIIPTLGQGGAERFLVDLLLNLDRNIFEPTLILFKRGGVWLKELELRDIKVILLKKNFKFDPLNFFKIVKELKRIRPEIVHTQLGGDLYGRLAAKLLNVPIIVSTEQNLNPDENAIQNILKKFTSRFAVKIVAISEAVKNDLIYRYQISKNKIEIIPNGLDIDKFLNLKKEIKNKEPEAITLGTIGRLVPQKGHNILIEALAKIKDLDFECLIAGLGALEDNLEKQIKSSGLEEKVKLIGGIENVPAFLSSLDAFIFPSLWEGQGIALLEAALSGIPIIASRVDGIKEVLNEETAYLVKPGDAADLAARISWLLNNLASEPVKARTLKLKNEIADKYSIVKIAASYQKLYQELIKDYENTAS